MELVEDQVWCDVHGCIHDACRDPYTMGVIECGPDEWRKLWAGGTVKLWTAAEVDHHAGRVKG